MDDIVPIPQGFEFASHGAGLRYKDRDDLALVYSKVPAVGAGVFTKNLFQAAPVTVARENLSKAKTVRAVLLNAGQANACTGDQGLADCRETLKLVGKGLGISPGEILPASTGVIGQQFDMAVWRREVPGLTAKLGQKTPLDLAKAIMTTDTYPKLAWESVDIGGKEVRILGLAKGSGMICPNMATMLGVVICDAKIKPVKWREVLIAAVDGSFNAVTVDGDTSTNDCVLALANAASGVEVDSPRDLAALGEAVSEVCRSLAYMVVEDAEGGTKIIRIKVDGAEDNMAAEAAARAVGNSPLVKTAMFGGDANWGRIVAALGRSGADFDPNKVCVSIGQIPVFANGQPVAGDIDGLLAPRMRRAEISVEICLGQGDGEYLLLASDLTCEYVRINADYRS